MTYICDRYDLHAQYIKILEYIDHLNDMYVLYTKSIRLLGLACEILYVMFTNISLYLAHRYYYICNE